MQIRFEGIPPWHRMKMTRGSAIPKSMPRIQFCVRVTLLIAVNPLPTSAVEGEEADGPLRAGEKTFPMRTTINAGRRLDVLSVLLSAGDGLQNGYNSLISGLTSPLIFRLPGTDPGGSELIRFAV
jgi:hypothetical protein